jgi:hypothetical protein
MAGFTSQDRDSRWPLFAQDGPGDRAKPGAWQLMILSHLSGPDGRCAGATDDEVFGMLGQWGAAGSWLEGRKLAVARELIRRRPDERNAGTATESGLPWDWDQRLAHEVALELRISVPAARKLLWAAWALEARLPGIGTALDEGRLDAGRVRTVVDETDVLLEPGKLARAEEIILAGLDACKSWTDLLRLVQRAVVTVDPDGAEKRREREEKEHARVRFWREAAGTCALMGAGLPTDEALQAHAHVEQRAQVYRAAGIKRPIDILRVAAYLDLLNLVPAADRIARFEAEDAAEAAGKARENAGKAPESDRDAREASGKAREESRNAPESDRDAREAAEGDQAGDPEGQAAGDAPGNTSGDDDAEGDPGSGDADGGSGGGPGGKGPANGPERGGSGSGSARDPGPAVAAEVNLTLRHLDIPFFTAAGTLTPANTAQRPGEARSLGPLDPGIARRLAEAAARHPDSTFCVTITDSDGHAIGHGCCKPGRRRKPGKRARGQRDGSPPTSPGAPGFTLTPGDGPGPPGGYGSWILTLPGQEVPGQDRELTVDLHPVPTGECGHQHESARHDPGDLLRHLVNVRDGKCGFPACSRHAKETDFEHATPFDKGGRTCGCNCWSCSRACHQVKQSEGWLVEEARPGYHQWTTPSGRRYTQEPWRYPG